MFVRNAMNAKMIASTGGTIRHMPPTSDTIPSTSDATAHVFVPDIASPAVPSIVNGSPHPRQLFIASGFSR